MAVVSQEIRRAASIHLRSGIQEQVCPFGHFISHPLNIQGVELRCENIIFLSAKSLAPDPVHLPVHLVVETIRLDEIPDVMVRLGVKAHERTANGVGSDFPRLLQA